MDRPGGVTERKIEATGPHQGTAGGKQGANENREGKRKGNSHFLAMTMNNAKGNNRMCVRGISVAFLVFPLSKEESFFKLLFIDVRERGRGESNIHVLLHYLRIHWSLLVCALVGGRTHNSN